MSWQFQSLARRRLSKEAGTIIKDWGGRLPIALVYPNTYRVGMSNLGFQTVYSLLNQDEEVVCERAFWDEREQEISGGKLFSLESQRELREFAAIAFSVTFELDYFNVVSALRAAKLPLLAEERDEGHPLIIGGGPCIAANPEPIAPFFDALAIGEAEAILPGLVEVLKTGIELPKSDLLRRMASIPGIYVPSLYRVTHGKDGAVESIAPDEGLPSTAFPVVRQVAHDLSLHPVHSVVVTPDTELGDMYLVEVSRGCSRACRFCLAGFVFLPAREQSVDAVVSQAAEGLKYRRRVGLVGAATSDHSRIGEIATRLRGIGASVAVSCLRLDSVTDELLVALIESGIKTVTFAPEAGSERMRRAINKRLSTERIIEAVEMTAWHRFQNMKLYYLVGLPDETDEDAQAIVDLTLQLKSIVERYQRKGQVTINLSPFVPKAQTPFQHQPMAEASTMERRIRLIRGGLRPAGVTVRYESPDWTEVQGVLARGDRRLGGVLAAVLRSSVREFRKAMSELDLDPDFYLRRPRREGEIVPWAAVRSGVGPGSSFPAGNEPYGHGDSEEVEACALP